MKRIILCADDYGQNSSISQAIIELIKLNRLSAVSCLTTSSDWPAQSQWLKPYLEKIDVGLHFNLTEGKPLSPELGSFFSLRELMLKAHMKKLDKKPLVAELRAQIDRFIEFMGFTPQFVDGHQHVHQFPIVRDALFEIYDERLGTENVYLRSTHNPNFLMEFKDPAYFKKLIIEFSGAIDFRKELDNKKIPHNKNFAGIYIFSTSYPAAFQRFLNQIPSEGMIMCHPGLYFADHTDKISGARHDEYIFLNSPEFSNLLTKDKVHIVRFR